VITSPLHNPNIVLKLLLILTVSVSISVSAAQILEMQNEADTGLEELSAKSFEAGQHSEDDNGNFSPADTSTGDAEDDFSKTDFYGSIRQYQNQIIEIENTHGVYDSQLTEPLIGLGMALKSQGEHASAIAPLNRAVHLARIADGLHSLRQVPIIEQMVDSLTESGDWQQATDKQLYLFKILKRNYLDNDIRLLEPVRRLSQWHTMAVAEDVADREFLHVLQARALAQREVVIIEKNYGAKSPELDQALFNIALANFQLAVLQSSAEQSSFDNFDSAGASTFGVGREGNQPPALSFNPFGAGKKVLVRRVELFDSNAKDNIGKKAKALAELGDWYLIFKKPESAMKTYLLAEQLGQAVPVSSVDSESQSSVVSSGGAGQEPSAAESTAIDANEKAKPSLFAQPRQLAFSLSRGSRELAKDKQLGFVQAQIDVTPSGRARDVVILDSNPPDAKHSRIRESIRSIKATRYRPRIVDGAPFLTKGLIVRHVFEF